VEYLMTRTGADALKKKIAVLEEKLRAVMKEKGHAAELDSNTWHDNFAFEEAQRQEQMLAFEIQRARAVLANARVIDVRKNLAVVTLGTKAKVEIMGRGMRTVTIVGYGEADLDSGCVAYNSPLGSCLIGAVAGDVRTYRVGERQFEVTVLEILNSESRRPA
jgi:transcription elongation GreA/GreB family factor